MSEIPENNNEINVEAHAAETEAHASVIEENAKETFNLAKEVFEWIYTIVIALVIAFLIKGFLFDVVKVDGPSMQNTLMNNDRLIVIKLGYKPQQQDIIILDSHYKNRQSHYEALEAAGEGYSWFEKQTHNMFNTGLPENLKKRYYIKRIIAMPGQTVDIDEATGKVFVDGIALDEPYYTGRTPITDRSVEYPVTVEEGHVFVMGDNRTNSTDSRSSSLGQVPIDAILGKAQFRIWPLNKIGVTK